MHLFDQILNMLNRHLLLSLLGFPGARKCSKTCNEAHATTKPIQIVSTVTDFVLFLNTEFYADDNAARATKNHVLYEAALHWLQLFSLAHIRISGDLLCGLLNIPWDAVLPPQPTLGFAVILLRLTNSGVTPDIANMTSAFEQSRTGINSQKIF